MKRTYSKVIESLANTLFPTREIFEPRKAETTRNDKCTNLFFPEFNIFKKMESIKIIKKNLKRFILGLNACTETFSYNWFKVKGKNYIKNTAAIAVQYKVHRQKGRTKWADWANIHIMTSAASFKWFQFPRSKTRIILHV